MNNKLSFFSEFCIGLFLFCASLPFVCSSFEIFNQVSFDACRSECVCDDAWEFVECVDSPRDVVDKVTCPQGEYLALEKKVCFCNKAICDIKYRCLAGAFICSCDDPHNCKPDLIEGTYIFKK